MKSILMREQQAATQQSPAEATALMNDTERRLPVILKQYPLLTYFGFGEFNRPAATTEEGRRDLLAAIAEIDRARAWLRTQQPRRTLNPRRSSYGLKHIAERATGDYISNGAFIAAVLLEGWKVRRISEISPNARLNISEKGLKRR